MPTKIDEITNLFKELKRNFLLSDADINNIKIIENNLNLHNCMAISDIYGAILYIEGLELYKSSKECLSISTILEKIGKPKLEEYLNKIKETELPVLPIPRASFDTRIVLSTYRKDVARILLKAHDILCNALKKIYLNANGIGYENYFSYTSDMLNSAYLRQITIDTKEQETQHSNIVGDMQRANVNINGVAAEKFRNCDENTAIKAIEDFTKDKVTEAGSKANKIKYFGGQWLYTALLQEFLCNTKIRLAGKQITIVASGSPKGQISWEEQEGIATASINFKIFTCQDDNGVSYALAADGRNLIMLTDEEFKIINARVNKAETNGCFDYHTTRITKYPQKTYHVAPLAEINAKIELQQDNNGKHYLKITEYGVNYSNSNMYLTNRNNVSLVSYNNSSPRLYKSEKPELKQQESRNIDDNKCRIM